MWLLLPLLLLLLPLGCRLLFDVVLASILSELESLPYYGLLFFPMGTWRHPPAAAAARVLAVGQSQSRLEEWPPLARQVAAAACGAIVRLRAAVGAATVDACQAAQACVMAAHLPLPSHSHSHSHSLSAVRSMLSKGLFPGRALASPRAATARPATRPYAHQPPGGSARVSLDPGRRLRRGVPSPVDRTQH